LPDPDKIYGPAADENSGHEEVSARQTSNADDDVDTSDVNSSDSESSNASDTSQSSDHHVTRCVVTAA